MEGRGRLYPCLPVLMNRTPLWQVHFLVKHQFTGDQFILVVFGWFVLFFFLFIFGKMSLLLGCSIGFLLFLGGIRGLVLCAYLTL